MTAPRGQTDDLGTGLKAEKREGLEMPKRDAHRHPGSSNLSLTAPIILFHDRVYAKAKTIERCNLAAALLFAWMELFFGKCRMDYSP